MIFSSLVLLFLSRWVSSCGWCQPQLDTLLHNRVCNIDKLVESSLKTMSFLRSNFCCSKSCSWYSWTYLSSTLVSHWMNFSSASSLNLIGKTYTFWAILSMNVMKYSLHLETFQASVHIWRCGLTIGGLVPCYNKSSVAPVFSSHIDNTARNQIRCVGDLRCS